MPEERDADERIGGTAGAAPSPRRRTYGRRKGRPLRPGQRALLEGLLPRLRIPLPPAGGALDPGTLFPRGDDGRPRPVWLEVGFGAGEHLAAQARANPGVGLIGCELYLNGVARLLARVERERLANVRIWPDDARLLIDALADGSIARAFVLFPDPWPKKRHHKRRFVRRENLDALARVLADGAELRLATDDPDYAGWMVERLQRHPDFVWTARRPADWRRRPGDWPATRYERKTSAAGARPVYLIYRRRPRGTGENP